MSALTILATKPCPPPWRLSNTRATGRRLRDRSQSRVTSTSRLHHLAPARVPHCGQIKQENNTLKEKVASLHGEVKRLTRQIGGGVAREPLGQSNASSLVSTPRRSVSNGVGNALSNGVGNALSNGVGMSGGGGCGPRQADEASAEVASLRSQLEELTAESTCLAEAMQVARRALRVDGGKEPSAPTATPTNAARTLFAEAVEESAAGDANGGRADTTKGDAKEMMACQGDAKEMMACGVDGSATVRALVAALASTRAGAEAAARQLGAQQRENQLLHAEVALYKPKGNSAVGLA